jgi:hypothetical protein
MTTIIALPTDLMILIRDYLIFLNLKTLPFFLSETTSLNMEKYILQENHWSWMNFLSMRKSEDWQIIRKSTMIWSLNNYESERYLKNGSFHDYLNSQMIGSSRQLHFHLRGFPMEYITFALGKNIGLLCCADAFGMQLSSLDSLHTLILSNCKELMRLGDAPNLKVLYVHKCLSLESFGEMKNLEVLHLETTSFSFFPSFPLETLKELSLKGTGIRHMLLAQVTRFKSLLTLFLHEESNILGDLPALPIPSLRSLEVFGLQPINITGLHELRHFTDSDGFVYFEDDASHYSHLSVKESNGESLAKISNKHELIVLRFLPEETDSLRVDRDIQNIYLHTDVRYIDGITPESQFLSVTLSSPDLTDISMFSRVQCVTLFSCLALSDISALQNVPYVSLRHCPAIQNFFYLGKQRYLGLEGFSNLTGEEFYNLNEVRCLEVFRCSNVRFIRGLTGTRRLTVFQCPKLWTVHLSGSEYLSISFNYCPSLSELQVAGKSVYSLTTVMCPKLPVAVQDPRRVQEGPRILQIPSGSYWNGVKVGSPTTITTTTTTTPTIVPTAATREAKEEQQPGTCGVGSCILC